MISVTTILHPTDFSPSAEEAFQLAEALAGGQKSNLVILHVVPPDGPAVFAGKMRVHVKRDEERNRRRDALRQLRPSNPRVSVEYRLAEGDVGAEIVRAANQSHADVIVMGSRGRTGLERLALGSVADQVMRQAPCPVVTVTATPVRHASPGPYSIREGSPGREPAAIG
jgi:nucleotide-binding universal stress UspA family protein